MATARATIVVDDSDTRVTTWTFDEAGHATGSHVHEFDYIVVPVTGGTFTVTSADGSTREMTQHAGEPYRGAAGTHHNVTSTTEASVVFVEVELKR